MENYARPPCYGCEERSATCHSDCERYLDYRAFVDKKRKERLNDSIALCIFKQKQTRNIKYKQRLSGTSAVWRGK